MRKLEGRFEVFMHDGREMRATDLKGGDAGVLHHYLCYDHVREFLFLAGQRSFTTVRKEEKTWKGKREQRGK